MRFHGLVLLCLAAACAPAPTPPDTIRITIPRGATARAVTQTLVQEGVVASSALLRFYARVRGRERAIRAGTFDFPRGTTARGALEILLRGRVAERRVVIPEGLRLTEVAAMVSDQLSIPADSFLEAAADPSLLAAFRIPDETAEGYLYPSTYLVPTDARAPAVVRQMLTEFASRWQPRWDQQLEALGLTRHEAVTLASIVEGEVRYRPDGRYVASVYHNRLGRGMRLQADPTVIYALGRRRRLFERDYQTRSPYNTYLIDGLPPGPIGQPSATSIEAVLYPARTDFLFLVARPDGKHVFSRTLREHLRAVAAVRRMGAGER